MLNDVKQALRALGRTPGFAVVAIAIVALGIGAATAMFSTLNAVVLRPVALPEPERLVTVYETNLPRNQPYFSVSVPNYFDWLQRTKSWNSLAAINWRAMNLTGDGPPELVQVKAITANFLSTLGIPLIAGRNFLAEEDRPGSAKVAIISVPFWQRRFGGSSDVIGRTLHFDGEPYTIVGVTGPGQPLPFDLEVAVPMAVDPAKEDRMNHELQVFGRLKPGVSIQQADAELKAVAAQIWSERPEMDQGWSTRLVPLALEVVKQDVRKGLYLLIGAVGLLLLLTCANLSNLLLVRATARAYELAVRSALGASRAQVIRLIVTESLVVIMVGGAIGVLVALWAVDLMRSLPLPRAEEISVDLRVLAVACVVTLLAGFFSGLGPALKTSRARPQDALKGRSPRSGHRSPLRDAMVVAQLAISLTLLVSATLLGRSFLQLLEVQPGFQTDHAVAISLRAMKDAAPFYERLTERIAALPQVDAVGVISGLPLTESNTSLNVFPVGESVLSKGQSIQAGWRLVDGGYFSAMRIPVVRGQTFQGLSPDEARRSVVISASLARLLWGDTDPVGRRLDPGGGGRELTVIGVVGDVRSRALSSEPEPAFYWSMHRFIYGPMHLVVRTTGDTAPLIAALRTVIKELDPNVPVFSVRTLNGIRATSLDQPRLILSLLGGFTGAALLLAALGTYGVIAFTVQQRTQEIGIRVALGAQRQDILTLLLGYVMRIVAIGALLGVAGAMASSRVLSAMLFQTGTTDPTSYLVAVVALVVTALGAAFLPARRATHVDPVVALRAQ